MCHCRAVSFQVSGRVNGQRIVFLSEFAALLSMLAYSCPGIRIGRRFSARGSYPPN
jgi:hypothetical protein